MSIIAARDQTFYVRACRICLQSNSEDFIVLKNDNKWLQRFEFCFGISLNNQDEPKILCKECAEDVYNYSMFKENCHNTDRFWKSITNSEACKVDLIRHMETTECIYNDKIIMINKKYSICSDNRYTNNTFETYSNDFESGNVDDFDNGNFDDYDNGNVDDGNIEDLDKCNVNDSGNVEVKKELFTNILKKYEAHEHEIDLVSNIKEEIQNNNTETEGLNNIGTTGNDVVNAIDIEILPYNIAPKPEHIRPIYGSKKRVDHSKFSRHKYVFKCKNCQKTCVSTTLYVKHLKQCHSMKSELGDKSQNQLKESEDKKSQTLPNTEKETEIQVTHSSNICGICDYSANSTDDIYKHLHEHWSNNELDCQLCKYSGKDQAAIAAHRYTHHNKQYFFLRCHICQATFKAQLSLEFHYRKVHLNKIGGLCSHPNCDKVYERCQLWKRHEKMHNHPGYVCDICGQKFTQKHAIVDHVKHHTQLPSYVCDFCGKRFKRPFNLSLHIENSHVKTDPVKCTHCDKLFPNVRKLNRHIRHVSREKLFKCQLCPRAYAVPSVLANHMKSHSDEKPHCCHVCGFKFKRLTHLRTHLERHSGSKPFKCTVCPKSFVTMSELKQHLAIHKKPPYECTHCTKTYRVKRRFVNHCALLHKNEKIDTNAIK